MEMDAITQPHPSALWNTNGYAAAIQGVLQYSTKVMEFGAVNCQTSFELLQQWSTATSPSAFIECTTRHARKQFDTLSDQAKALTELAQQVTLAAVEEKSAEKHAG